MAVVTIITNGQKRRLKGSEGESLYSLLSSEGLLTAPCGGSGLCGKCRVRFISSPAPPVADELEIFTDSQLKAGWRLACLYPLMGEICIELPQLTENKLKVNFCEQAEQGEMLALALDLGTTSLVACLLDTKGQKKAEAFCLNSQRFFGADIISRLNYAAKSNGQKQLQNAVCADIRQLLFALCSAVGADKKQIKHAVVAANTAMLALLCGIDTTSLGQAPYRLMCDLPQQVNSAQLPLGLDAGSVIDLIAPFDGFIGGDVRAGLTALDFGSDGGTSLFLDLGTNGEIVLAVRGQYYAASAAAGPVFEGFGLDCGMSAQSGAIYQAGLTDGKLAYKTIDDAPALGICGSGLFDLLRIGLQSGAISKRGRLQKEHPLVREIGNKRALVVDIARGIYLTQDDIRQAQLAKAAIRAALKQLCMQAHILEGEISRAVIAGSLGSNLNEKALITVGLLPDTLYSKISFAGNTSLAGSVIYLQNISLFNKAVNVVYLAEYAEYKKLFIQEINFL